MQFFQVSYERFLEEIRIEDITETGKDKLECEDLGDALAYYLTSIDRPKGFVYVVLKKELTEVQIMQLKPISRLSKRIDDSSKLRQMVQTLERIEQSLKIPNEKIIERVEVVEVEVEKKK